MQNAVLWALIATIGTWAVTALGALTVVFFRKTKLNIMNLMLGFAAGVMIAASFWSLLEPSIELAKEYNKLPAFIIATSGFIFGTVFMWSTDKLILKINKRNSHNKNNRTLMLVLSITLHNIPEGLAVGVAFGVLNINGFTPEGLIGACTLALGIAIQNFPEGAAVSLPLRRDGASITKSFLIGQASGIVEPIAGVLGALLVVKTQTILPFLLAFAAGAMILVSVHELIPECQKIQNNKPYFATFGIIAGFAVMMLLDVALG